MNFYEHHIGDFAEATAHLSFVEDAAYSRLIRKYYSTEKPLPADPAAVERLVGAKSRHEKEAVRTVLKEFFFLSDDGFHNKRCDEELARYHEKQNKARRSAGTRWEKERAGKTVTSNIVGDANALPMHSERNASDTVSSRQSHNGRNALQSPVPSPQSPDSGVLRPSTPDPDVRTPNKGQHTSREIRQGSRVFSGDPCTAAIQARYPEGTFAAKNWQLAEREIGKLLDQGVSETELIDAAAKYCEQQRAKGDSIGTQFIRSPEKFFGEGYWRGPFPLPATKAETRLAGNLSAADEFMRRTEIA